MPAAKRTLRYHQDLPAAAVDAAAPAYAPGEGPARQLQWHVATSLGRADMLAPGVRPGPGDILLDRAIEGFSRAIGVVLFAAALAAVALLIV